MEPNADLSTAPAPSEPLINVRDPDTLEVGSVPQSQLQDALSQGYAEATPEQVHSFIQKQKYGTLPQQAATALEGAGSSATFGLSTGLERLAGVDPEDIRGRAEENPYAHFTGEIAGLFTPGGAGKVLTAAGEGTVKALGLVGESALSKIGSAAVKNAAESALFQGGSEISKLLASDPNQSVESAITNIGLAGVIGTGVGGALGSVNPLWNVTVGPKVQNILEAISKKGGGEASEAIEKILQSSGMEAAPEVKQAIQGDPWAKQMAETLQQSDTTQSGLEFQKTLKDFRSQANDKLIESLGRTKEDIVPPSEFSNYQKGKEIGSTLADELEQRIAPTVKKFEDLKAKYANVELPQSQEVEVPSGNPYLPAKKVIRPGLSDQISNEIGNLAQQEGWYSSPSSDIMKEVQRVMKELPQQKTLKDLSNYITQVGANTADYTRPDLMRAGMLMKGVMREAEADMVTAKLGAESPQLVAEHAQARSEWKIASQLKDALNDRLHVGGGDSVGSFIKNLKVMAQTDGESLIRRLSGKNDADLLKVLQENFPATSAQLRNYHVDSLLSSAAKTAKPGEVVNAGKLLENLKKMSPELRDFALSPEVQNQMKSIGTLLDGLKSDTYNFSNTGRTADKLLNYLPGSAVAMVTMLAAHNPLLAVALGGLTKVLGRDVPDAVRLSLLKFLGSGAKIEPEGFKAMVSMIQHTIEGENLVSKSAKNLFRSSGPVISSSLIPSDKKKDQLDKQLEKLKVDNSPLFNVGGKTAHYLPEQGTALAQTAMNAVNYLNQLRPGTGKQNPLDTEVKPTSIQKSTYDRALTIAEQPLSLLNHIQEGTLLPQDLVTLHSLYPNLYNRLNQKLTSELIQAVDRGEKIPYRMRLSLSMFLGQNLDSTMTPQAIQSSQMALMPAPSSSSMNSEAPRQKHSMMSLNKWPMQSATPNQAREQARLK